MLERAYLQEWSPNPREVKRSLEVDFSTEFGPGSVYHNIQGIELHQPLDTEYQWDLQF